MKMISFVVYGEPMGKQRPKFSSIGRFVKTYTPKETTYYESGVINAFKQAQEKIGFEKWLPNQMIYANITAYYRIPKVHYKFHKKTNTTDLDKSGVDMKNGVIRPTKKPDCDNIAKICLDALNGIAYDDDSQITTIFVRKYYSEEPRVEITLTDELVREIEKYE